MSASETDDANGTSEREGRREKEIEPFEQASEAITMHGGEHKRPGAQG